jgi:outer membrane protein assembly factor BamD (BamD/ComL family)
MTPKEKAQELFDKYYRLFNNFPNYQYVIENLNTIQDEKLYTTKKCALIAVDEIMNVLNKHLPAEDYKVMNYYEEVKQEIEAL